MIKVNLLRAQRDRKRLATAPVKIPPVATLLLVYVLLLVGGLGAGWYYLKSQVDGLSARAAELRREEQRLQGLKKQLAVYEAKKKDTESRIEVIEHLKDLQTGPVLLLNHVISSLPRDAAIWLTLVDQKQDKIKLTGHTVRGETIPDFMSNLISTGFFHTVDLELYEDLAKESSPKDPAKFVLVCTTKKKMPTE